MEDLWKSTGEVIRERLLSPVIGPFITAWAAWNYKFFTVLLSENTATTTFRLIGDLYPTATERLCQGFFYPLGTAAIYILGIPHLERIVLTLSLGVQQKVLDLKRRHATLSFLTEEDSAKLRADMASLRLAQRSEIERKDEAFRALTDECTVLKTQLDQATTREMKAAAGAIDAPGNLSELESKLLGLVGASKEPLSLQAIISNGMASPEEISTELKLLMRRGMLLSGSNDEGGTSYELSNIGKEHPLASPLPKENRTNLEVVAESFKTSLDQLEQSRKAGSIGLNPRHQELLARIASLGGSVSPAAIKDGITGLNRVRLMDDLEELKGKEFIDSTTTSISLTKKGRKAVLPAS